MKRDFLVVFENDSAYQVMCHFEKGTPNAVNTYESIVNLQEEFPDVEWCIVTSFDGWVGVKMDPENPYAQPKIYLARRTTVGED
jgi:hypothetical protein